MGDEVGDLSRRLRAFGAEPVRGPVERAEERPRGDGGVGRVQRAAPHAVGDERADAALVAIALRDDPRSETRRQRVDLQVRRGSFDFVDQTEHVRDGDLPQAVGQRAGAAARGGERLKQAIERSVLAEEQQLVLAPEVVIEVAGREVCRHGDVAHAGGREPARAEHARRRPHDLDAARLGALQTAVRKMNHGSILAPFGTRVEPRRPRPREEAP